MYLHAYLKGTAMNVYLMISHLPVRMHLLLPTCILESNRCFKPAGGFLSLDLRRKLASNNVVMATSASYYIPRVVQALKR